MNRGGSVLDQVLFGAMRWQSVEVQVSRRVPLRKRSVEEVGLPDILVHATVMLRTVGRRLHPYSPAGLASHPCLPLAVFGSIAVVGSLKRGLGSRVWRLGRRVATRFRVPPEAATVQVR